MSERLPAPDTSRFPDLASDASWVRELATGTGFARIFKAGGPHPAAWYDFRTYGPVDARFDPHPEPPGDYPECGVMYAALESRATTSTGGDPLAAFAACLLEVFQSTRIVRRGDDDSTLVIFENARPLRLLDLSDSDWITVAGGNAAISSGDHSDARSWARAIHAHYPELDGIVSASSVVPTARVVALWSTAADALPRHPLARLRLDRDELTGIIDRIADRYGYVVL
ncbi:RES family NAD+ phosphorylase [Leucobacter sp. NPDC058333]|uniref:RES family NAD+ phosphorylase n=1 Tax=Leucobacter sp. NPDC058333 TaxID=3346450 RepID=UPI003658CA6C